MVTRYRGGISRTATLGLAWSLCGMIPTLGTSVNCNGLLVQLVEG